MRHASLSASKKEVKINTFFEGIFKTPYYDMRHLLKYFHPDQFNRNIPPALQKEWQANNWINLPFLMLTEIRKKPQISQEGQSNNPEQERRTFDSEAFLQDPTVKIIIFFCYLFIKLGFYTPEVPRLGEKDPYPRRLLKHYSLSYYLIYFQKHLVFG